MKGLDFMGINRKRYICYFQPQFYDKLESFENEYKNLYPDAARITGTVRTFDEDVQDLVEESINQIVKSTCEGAGADFDLRYKRGYPILRNDAKETNRLKTLAETLLGSENVQEMELMMGGEDFAYYLQKKPGAFFFVGAANPDIGATYPHHHPKFDVDERAMLNTGKLFLSAFLAR